MFTLLFNDRNSAFDIESPNFTEEGSKEIESVVKDILNFGELSVDLTYSHESFELDFNGLKGKLEPFTPYMVILKWSKKNFITEMNIYKYIALFGCFIYGLMQIFFSCGQPTTNMSFPFVFL